LRVALAPGVAASERARRERDEAREDDEGAHGSSTPERARSRNLARGSRAMVHEVAAPRALVVALLLASPACGGGVGSIGAVLGRDNDSGALYVREVPKGMAAAKAGLVPGDRVLMIDGVYVNQLDAKDIRAKLRGDIGSSVELTVVRGTEVRRVKLTR